MHTGNYSQHEKSFLLHTSHFAYPTCQSSFFLYFLQIPLHIFKTDLAAGHSPLILIPNGVVGFLLLLLVRADPEWPPTDAVPSGGRPALPTA